MVLKLYVEHPIAKMICPTRIAMENVTSISRAPKRSTSTPPKNGSKMFGIEYNVYSKFYTHTHTHVDKHIIRQSPK